ncbi:MAG: hypothetical protein ACM4D3_24670 [Candidatus Sericytochromatia bacterium]
MCTFQCTAPTSALVLTVPNGLVVRLVVVVVRLVLVVLVALVLLGGWVPAA